MQWLRRTLTTRGAAFLGCGIVLTAAGIVLGQTDVTRAGVLLLALVVISLLLARRHGLALEVSREVSPSRVAIDERATVTLRVRNVEGSPTPVMLAEEALDYALGDRPRFVLSSLRPGRAEEVRYTVRSHARGVHRVGPLRLRVRDPFGLTLRSSAVHGGDEVVVLPRVLPLGSGRALGSGIGSDGSVPHMIALHGEDDQTIREYRDGDDLRRIHWPATARTGDLMVRQEDRPTKRRVVLLVDAREIGHAGSVRSGSLEWTVTTAASVLVHLADASHAVHLLTADPTSDRRVRHDTTVPSALDALARVTPQGEDAMRGVLHDAAVLTASGGLVVYVGGPLSDEDTHTLAALRQPGSSAVALVVEPDTFGRRTEGAPAAGAGATVATLRGSGWLTRTVDGSTSPGQAWSDAVGGSVAQVHA